MTVPSSVVWPTGLPNPTMSPHNFDARMGVVRTGMAAGNAKQRRMFKHMPSIWSVEWHATTAQMQQITQFAHRNGYAWFELPLVSMYATDNISPLTVRLVEGLAYRSLGHDWWSITTAVEVSPEVYQTAPVITNRWIVARTPVSPSSPDWYIAGSPNAPSTPDWVLAGTPATPSAFA